MDEKAAVGLYYYLVYFDYDYATKEILSRGDPTMPPRRSYQEVILLRYLPVAPMIG